MDPQDLVEIEQIKQLKARYFRLMDTRQWDEWRECFAEDVQVRIELGRGDPDDVKTGRDEFVESVSLVLEPTRTVHHGHMPEIELTGKDTARGIWAMYDYVTWGGDNDLKGYGHYHETYTKRDSRWRIQSMHLTRLRVDSPDRW